MVKLFWFYRQACKYFAPKIRRCGRWRKRTSQNSMAVSRKTSYDFKRNARFGMSSFLSGFNTVNFSESLAGSGIDWKKKSLRERDGLCDRLLRLVEETGCIRREYLGIDSFTVCLDCDGIGDVSLLIIVNSMCLTLVTLVYIYIQLTGTVFLIGRTLMCYIAVY